ncbi:hypothetical protein FQN54_001712 [Arachnomyces sp. PD_36]|nr:hypothetical protein FQN54_001712 [Arachnomyces sp. PD_36]
MADCLAIDLPETGGGTLYLTAGATCAVEAIKDRTKSLHEHIQHDLEEAKKVVRGIRSNEPVAIADRKIGDVETFVTGTTDTAALHAAKKVATAVKDAYTHAQTAATADSLRLADPTNTVKKDTATNARESAEEKINHADLSLADIGLSYDTNKKKTVLVVGGGVSGLMTAWILLDKGYKVCIVAKEWAKTEATKNDVSAETGDRSDRMTSQIAGALWEYPPGGCGLSEIEVPVLAYSKLEQYQKWAMQSFLFYDKIAKVKGFGAQTKTLYQFFYNDSRDEEAAAGEEGKQAMRNAELHFAKYRKIKQTQNQDCFKELKVKHLNITKNPDPADPGWKDALGRIQHTSHGVKWGYRHKAPVIDTDTAMGFLMDLVKGKGAVLETRALQGDLHLHERELMDDFQADIIVNASGLGARQLAKDEQVFPVRGAVRRVLLGSSSAPSEQPNENTEQRAARELEAERVKSDQFLKGNALLVPAQYDKRNQPSKTIFIVPRRDDTLIVGSIIQRNNWQLNNLTKNSPEVQMMWDRANSFVKGIRDEDPPDGRALARGLRPFSHSNVRVSADIRTNSCRVVHNYGHGGSGWTLAVGCAWSCVQIVEKMLLEGKSGAIANTEVLGLVDG